jgi:catechol 2,3-dioxygenase-like lactoylglutathione lyase family enzyme
MRIERLDHLVLTVHDVQVTADFYARVLGMRVETFADDARTFRFGSLYFGDQKINLHQAGHEFEPKALYPTPGAGDLCFITTASPNEVIQHVRAFGVAILEGPVPRTGALGPMTSVYFRDPDQNLIEIAHYDER